MVTRRPIKKNKTRSGKNILFAIFFHKNVIQLKNTLSDFFFFANFKKGNSSCNRLKTNETFNFLILGMCWNFSSMTPYLMQKGDLQPGPHYIYIVTQILLSCTRKNNKTKLFLTKKQPTFRSAFGANLQLCITFYPTTKSLRMKGQLS